MLAMILPGLLIALINAPILWYFWSRKMAWWEYLPPVLINLLVCLIVKWSVQFGMTSDWEYWGGWATVTYHQEPWTEWYEVTVTDYCDKTNPDGSTTRVACGSHTETHYTQHAEEWWVENSNGERINTDAGDYTGLVGLWANEKREAGHHDDYHRVKFGWNNSGDGYKYHSTWPRTDVTLVPTTTQHRYTNKVQAANRSLFHFRKVSKQDLSDYGVHELPGIERFYRMRYIQGEAGAGADQANARLEFWNARMGSLKQVQMRILVFVDKPIEAAFTQEAHWQGGNKNEFIVCVGLDGRTRECRWAHVISWTEAELLKIRVRDFARSMKVFDPVALVDYMVPEVDRGFLRKHFKDFDYLTIDIPAWAYWLAFFLTLGATVGWDVVAVKNDIDPDNPVPRRRSRSTMSYGSAGSFRRW